MHENLVSEQVGRPSGALMARRHRAVVARGDAQMAAVTGVAASKQNPGQMDFRATRPGRKRDMEQLTPHDGVRSAPVVPNRSAGLMAYETAPGRTSALRPRVLRSSAYVGLLVSGALVFFLPWLLASQFSIKVAPAWGLGDFGFALCAVGALIGMLIGRRLKL